MGYYRHEGPFEYNEEDGFYYTKDGVRVNEKGEELKSNGHRKAIHVGVLANRKSKDGKRRKDKFGNWRPIVTHRGRRKRAGVGVGSHSKKKTRPRKVNRKGKTSKKGYTLIITPRGNRYYRRHKKPGPKGGWSAGDPKSDWNYEQVMEWVTCPGGGKYLRVEGRTRPGAEENHWMSLDDTREMVLKYCPGKSRVEYQRWVRNKNVMWTPIWPDCIKGWEDFYQRGGWPWFLNTNNVSIKDKYASEGEEFVSYWEAVRIVRPLKLEGATDYKELMESGKYEGVLPRTPHYVYKDHWMGWKAFLGHDAFVNASDMAEEPRYWYVEEVGINLYRFGDIREGQLREKEKLVRLYVYEEDRKEVWDRVIDVMTEEYDEDVRAVPNIHSILFELDNVLLIKR